MEAVPVIAVFDIGKTNKKLFLLDESYQIVYEKSGRLEETTDEDGFPCEDLEKLNIFILDSLNEIIALEEFSVRAVNFSAYGASFVYLDNDGKPAAPLYNYLKPYPEQLSNELYRRYGGGARFASETASPVLGSLNSGLQLYRIKKERPELFGRIKYALHLPQYLSFLLTGWFYSDITSIGCHTALWDFERNSYHEWVNNEGITQKLAPILPCNLVFDITFKGKTIKVGSGLHDSSAALIPYLFSFHEPFVLISTGTWNISLNPFDHSPLTIPELQNDCLCYLQYNGKPVKAARLFASYEHDEGLKRIVTHFNCDAAQFSKIVPDPAIIAKLRGIASSQSFAEQDLPVFKSPAEAYHSLVLDIVLRQQASTRLILKGESVRKIFVDGGFSKNALFMLLLSEAFPAIEIYAASVAQASAIGAAMVIHRHWNTKPVPENIIELERPVI